MNEMFMWIEQTTEIKNVKDLLNDYDVEIETADGWQPVSEFVDKGDWNGYQAIANGRSVIVNEAHLFDTCRGWLSARDLVGCFDVTVLMDDGNYHPITVFELNQMVPIVDVQIDHPNHRYFANGFSSHNTNVGKSHMLCSLATDYMLDGLNVLYITLEMSEMRIAQRIDANLLDIPIQDIEEIPESTYEARFQKVLDHEGRGQLVIKEFPAKTAGALKIKALVDELKIKRNFRPDVIILDYLNLCKSDLIKMTENMYIYIKTVAEELRGLAQELNLPIISATQTNRDGQNSTDLDLTEMAESHGLSMTADLIIALIVTEQLEEMKQMRGKTIKNRYGPKWQSFLLGNDRQHMRIFNLTDPSLRPKWVPKSMRKAEHHSDSASEEVVAQGSDDTPPWEEPAETPTLKKRSFEDWTV